jgi:putative ABC transport system substrate-binding protein
MFDRPKRREIIALIGGAAVSLVSSRAAHAQQGARVRRIGVFMPGSAENSEFQDRIAAFVQGLGALGWAVGRNVRIDYRWGVGQVDRYATMAEELVALAPDVILANGTATVSALKKATRTLPIVFANMTDPVGSGLVASLAKPGGNATGFIATEFGFGGKWLELLKEIAPRMTRAVVLRDAAIASQVGMLGGLQSVAPSLGVELRPLDLRDEDEIRRSVAAFASEPNGGLIVIPGARAILRRDLLIALAAQYRLPTVYGIHSDVTAGGLMSYAADSIEVYRRAAGYIDRILKGEKPADLPVQAPVKYELTINLKTAKALGLDVPAQLLARADEVIE